MLTERALDTAAVRVAYVESVAAGPPLLFLHGITGRWQYFLPIIHSFLARWKVCAMDSRGHGRSGHVLTGYRLDELAADATRLLCTASDAPAVLYGHSYGALMALLVAVSSPERVRALILEDPPLFVHLNLRATIWYERFSRIRDLAGTELPFRELVAALQRLRPGEWPTYYGYWAESLSLMDADVLTMYLDGRATDGFDIEQLLRSISCPSLLLHADPGCGAALTAAEAQRARSLLRDCTYVPFADTPHALSAARPLDVVQISNQFLEPLRAQRVAG